MPKLPPLLLRFCGVLRHRLFSANKTESEVVKLFFPISKAAIVYSELTQQFHSSYLVMVELILIVVYVKIGVLGTGSSIQFINCVIIDFLFCSQLGNE